MVEHSSMELLRIIVGEDERWGHHPLYEELLERFCDIGCRGATATRAIAGFGPQRKIHSERILRFSSEQPVIIEVVDSVEIIDRCVDLLEKMVPHGVATREKVHVVMFQPSPSE